MSQQHYSKDLEKRFLTAPSVRFATPTDVNFKDLCSCQDGESASLGPYLSLIGALLWVSQCTRADVAFAVNRLSQFLRDPSESHWFAALRVLNYLITTKHLQLCLGGDLNLSGYSNSDWAEDRETRHSTSTYTFRIGQGLVS